jgi:hypothetical protein
MYRTVTLNFLGPRLEVTTSKVLTTTDVSHPGSVDHVTNAEIRALSRFWLDSLAPFKSSLQYSRTTEAGGVSPEAIPDCAPPNVPIKQSKGAML